MADELTLGQLIEKMQSASRDVHAAEYFSGRAWIKLCVANDTVRKCEHSLHTATQECEWARKRLKDLRDANVPQISALRSQKDSALQKKKQFQFAARSAQNRGIKQRADIFSAEADRIETEVQRIDSAKNLLCDEIHQAKKSYAKSLDSLVLAHSALSSALREHELQKALYEEASGVLKQATGEYERVKDAVRSKSEGESLVLNRSHPVCVTNLR